MNKKIDENNVKIEEMSGDCFRYIRNYAHLTQQEVAEQCKHKSKSWTHYLEKQQVVDAWVVSQLYKIATPVIIVKALENYKNGIRLPERAKYIRKRKDETEIVTVASNRTSRKNKGKAIVKWDVKL